MANQIKKCVLHGAVNNETVDLYPRTNLASVADMTAFARTLNGAADAAAARNTLGITTQAALINIIYPVGSVITLTNDTDPNELYQGTTWVKMEAGRVLVSAGKYTESGFSHTYTLDEKGGEAKHQLTTDELPKISPKITVNTQNATGYIDSGAEALNGNPNAASGVFKSTVNNNHRNTGGANDHQNRINFNYNHGHVATMEPLGSNVSHQNMPPYEAVQRWKRTA